MIFKRTALLFLAVIASASVIVTGCGPEENGNGGDSGKADSGNITVEIKGKIFSIPSPIQTAFLIKKTGAAFDKNILNASENSTSYSTKYQKALNLGAYGCDLGYLTMYDQNGDALKYFVATQKLGDDLDVSAAFDKSLMERFQKNIGKKDSMLVLVSTAYRASDAFLKNNDRSDIGALIIAGGWIEALYFAAQTAKANSNQEIVNRIAEQKTTLGNLVGLLETYAGDEEYSELLSQLKGLQADFEGIEYTYIYNKPTTDEAKKMTIFTSKSEVKITPEQLKSITEKIEALRKLVTG